MDVSAINLPKTERFACTKRQMKLAFSEACPDAVEFGSYQRYFNASRPWDSKYLGQPRPRYKPRVQVTGLVVAALTVRGVRHPLLEGKPPRSSLRFYALPREKYPDESTLDFVEKALPEMRKWLQAQLAKPETTRVGLDEDLLVEWTGGKHVTRAVRYVIK
jgi:hypothetical protein